MPVALAHGGPRHCQCQWQRTFPRNDPDICHVLYVCNLKFKLRQGLTHLAQGTPRANLRRVSTRRAPCCYHSLHPSRCFYQEHDEGAWQVGTPSQP